MSDSEYTDNEYNSDYDDDDYLITHVIYDPEEESRTKYNISLCELYNKRLHGDGDINPVNHFLVHSRYKKLDMKFINDIANNINNEYLYLDNKSHDIFRNYKEIIRKDNYVKPEIMECIYLSTGHCIGIKKTFWLKIIQRKWKDICKKREIIIRKCLNPNSLRHREITGKWPDECFKYPQMKGMLSNLKN
jgi:hypothetical protein